MPAIFQHAICEADVVSVAGGAPNPHSTSSEIVHVQEAGGRIVAASSEPQTIATCVSNGDVSYRDTLTIAPVQSSDGLIRRALRFAG